MWTHVVWTWNCSKILQLMSVGLAWKSAAKFWTISGSHNMGSQLLQNTEINIVVHWKFWRKYGPVSHLFSCTFKNLASFLKHPVPYSCAFTRKNRTGSFLIHPRKWIYNAISPVGRFRPSSQDIFSPTPLYYFPISIWRFFFSPQSLCLCKEEISNKHQVCIISNYMNLPEFKEFTRGK